MEHGGEPPTTSRQPGREGNASLPRGNFYVDGDELVLFNNISIAKARLSAGARPPKQRTN
jgi:hypothetical protein